jgi:hypothetical protein
LTRVVLSSFRSAPAQDDAIWLDHGRHEISVRTPRLAIARLSLLQFRLASYILVSPKSLNQWDLAAWLYEEREDGGPDWSNVCVRNLLWHARRKLAPLGLRLTIAGGNRGIASAHYRIVDNRSASIAARSRRECGFYTNATRRAVTRLGPATRARLSASRQRSTQS